MTGRQRGFETAPLQRNLFGCGSEALPATLDAWVFFPRVLVVRHGYTVLCAWVGAADPFGRYFGG